MIIRGQQRATHSDPERVSGRARELAECGTTCSNTTERQQAERRVDILPEDTQKRALHFAPYPEDLYKIPMLATCPEGGAVLDPFTGTGTTNFVAFALGRKSIGIDIADEYLTVARARCRLLL